jgi:DNA-binding CsgD family transcriptional regulator/PAS domain-containing protein
MRPRRGGSLGQGQVARGGKVSEHGYPDQAINACYDAVLAPETWPAALDRLARSADSVGTAFYPVSGPLLLPHVPVAVEIEGVVEEFVRDGWWMQHYRAERALPLFLLGRPVVVEDQITTRDERRRLPAYNDFFLRHGLPWWAAVSYQSEEGGAWVVPFLRDARQGPFLPHDAVRLTRLQPHFRRIMGLTSRVASSRVETALTTLERAGFPAILVDWRGHATQLNPAAEALLGRDLFIDGGRLGVRDRDDNEALRRLVKRAVTSASPADIAEASPVSIARPPGRPLLIDAVPTGGLLADAFRHSRALLLITDLDRKPVPTERRLRRAFSLTDDEARLTTLLSEGMTLGQATDVLKMARETADDRLTAIFAKTGVSSQSELAALVARVAEAPLS